MQPQKHRSVEATSTPFSDTVLQLLGQKRMESKTTLVTKLPFGPLKIHCDNPSAIDEFATTFRHYMHDDLPSDVRYSSSIFATDEQLWEQLKTHLTMTHSFNGAELFTWAGGSGVIIDGTFAIFVPSEPDTDFYILASNRPFMSGAIETTKFTFYSENPDYCADWPVVSDLIKGMYAFRTNTFCLHSALLERNGKGVLLVGDSGAGKTTASLALARAGFTFMTDDLLFLNSENELGITATGLLMSPNFVGQGPAQLQDLESTLEQGDVDKSSVKLDHFQVRSSTNIFVKPDLILLLEKPEQRCADHQIYQLEAQSALAEIMDQVVDPMAMSRRIEHLNLTGKLIEQCVVKRLITGRNLAELATLVDSELEQIP